jgi:hypothetical protein
MIRLGESLLGGLVAAVLTRSTVLALVVVVVLYLGWSSSKWGYLGQIDQEIERERKEDHEQQGPEH